MLQRKGFSIRERLLNLCLLNEALEELLSKDKKLKGFKTLLQALLADEQQAEFLKLGRVLPVEMSIFIKDLFSILDKYFMKESYKGDIKYMNLLTKCFHLKDGVTVGELAVIYDDISSDYQKYVLSKYKMFQENYLVYQWFRNVQPIMTDKTITENIIVFLLYFRIQELFLMLEATNNKARITGEQIAECIGYGTYITEHSNMLFEICSEYIDERKYSITDIMRIWLPK